MIAVVDDNDIYACDVATPGQECPQGDLSEIDLHRKCSRRQNACCAVLAQGKQVIFISGHQSVG